MNHDEHKAIREEVKSMMPQLKKRRNRRRNIRKKLRRRP